MIKEICLGKNIFITQCPCCHSFLQYEKEDIEKQLDIWGGFDDYVTCSVCGDDIYNAPGCRGRYD